MEYQDTPEGIADDMDGWGEPPQLCAECMNFKNQLGGVCSLGDDVIKANAEAEAGTIDLARKLLHSWLGDPESINDCPLYKYGASEL